MTGQSAADRAWARALAAWLRAGGDSIAARAAAQRAQDRAEFARRRGHGLRLRHARKLARTTTTEEEQ